MPINRPYRRTCRQFSSGGYNGNGQAGYVLHPKFAQDPRHYTTAFALLQRDFMHLLDYVEPADVNLPCFSHRIQQLLMRTCVEVEANLTAILVENEFAKRGDHLTMSDYIKVEESHRLSSFEARITGWRGRKNIWKPFEAWKSGKKLPWYAAYNKSKHDRHECFNLATFEALVNAMTGLIILLSAQFMDEDFSSSNKGLALESSASVVRVKS